MIGGMGPDIVETPGPSYVKEYHAAGMLEKPCLKRCTLPPS